MARDYLGREEESNDITSILQETDGSRRQIITLEGLGGMGKTQLVLKVADEMRDTLTAFFWINGKTKESVEQSFCKAAQRLRDSKTSSKFRWTRQDEQLVGETVKDVKRWLSTQNNTRWLLVFDNVDDPEAYDLRSYFPQAEQGFIFITTRSRRLDLGRVLHLKKFPKLGAESRDILAQTSGRSVELKGKQRARKEWICSKLTL